MLKAFGIETCAGLIASRGLLAALFSPVSTDFFMAAALGIGRTQVPERPTQHTWCACPSNFSIIGCSGNGTTHTKNVCSVP